MDSLIEENKQLKQEIKKLKEFINEHTVNVIKLEEEGVPDGPLIPESEDVGGLDVE